MEIALAVLLVLSFPVIAVAGFAIAIGARERVRTLEQRFADFQKAGPISPAAATMARQPAGSARVVIQPTGLFYQRLLFPRRIPAAPTPT